MYSEGRKSGEKLEHQRGEEAEDRQGDDQEVVGRPGNAFASGGDLLKKTPKFIFGLIGAAGTLAMLPFYMEGLYDNIYIILALVATAVTLLLSVDFRAVINLSSNDSKSQDGTGEFYIRLPWRLRKGKLSPEWELPGTHPESTAAWELRRF